MVNVGGRSKACSTCRRRRVKCDETQPICQRCQRQGLACDGPRDTTFIEATIVRSRRRIEPAPSASTTRTPPTPSTSSAVIQLPTPSAPLIPDPQEFYIMYTRQHLEPAGPIDTSLQHLLLHNLPPQNQPHARTSHLTAALGFATIFFGTAHNLPSITHQGLLSHSTTLRSINLALSEPSCWESDELLVSITTLAVQETLVPTGAGFYLNHMLGIDRLLGLRDARAFCGPGSLKLYKCLRHLILFAALRKGTGSVLARGDWKEVLQRSCGSEEESGEQELYDVLADCSVLVARRDGVERGRDREGMVGGAQDGELRRRALGLRGRLADWRTRWDGDASNAFSEIDAESITEHPALNHPPTILPDLVFSSSTSALLLMLYNTTLIYVLRILTSIHADTQDQQTIVDYTAAQRSALRQICQSMPNFSDATARTDIHSSPVPHWAVQVAGEMLEDDTSDEGRMMKDMLSRKGAGLLAQGL